MLRFTEKKIITKEISVNCINSRSFKSREINEENLLVRDELRGICRYGKGYCFTMSQLEMIVTALKQKLSKIELVGISFVIIFFSENLNIFFPPF